MTGEGARTLDILDLQERLRAFAAARDWETFHTPKNLAMALAAEGGELLEIFQWLTEQEALVLDEDGRERVSEELADIQIYLVRLADVLNVSIPSAIEAKLAKERQEVSSRAVERQCNQVLAQGRQVGAPLQRNDTGLRRGCHAESDR